MMRNFTQYMPWFHSRKGKVNDEPFSYRAWKWFFQRVLSDKWDSNLLERIESTDWDVLILLDACRYDTLASIADSAVVDRAISPATATGAFLSRTRARGVFDNAIYISANPQSECHSPGKSIDHVQVYETHWNERLRTVKPDDVYNAVSEHIERGPRIIAHTIQPHYPHICRINDHTFPVPNGLHPAELPFEHDEELRIQSILSRGLVNLADVRRSYRISVKFAWHVAVRAAVDLVSEGKTVVITADHGELIGEWGFVEHPTNVPLRPLIEVPWVVFSPPEPTASSNVTERLAALGYREEQDQ